MSIQVLTSRSTIIATGLIALVDDCIDRRWHSNKSFHLDLPRKEAADYLGPEELIDMVFNRQAHARHHRHYDVQHST
jgi:hypothetical protein